MMKEKLLKQFADNKLKVEYDAEINLKFAFDRHPEFKASYDRIRGLQLDYAKAKFEKNDTLKIAEAIKSEKANLHKIAEEQNINLLDLKPKYNCLKCKDSGKVGNEYCECFNTEMSKAILTLNGLNYNNLPDFDDMDFSIIKKLFCQKS